MELTKLFMNTIFLQQSVAYLRYIFFSSFQKKIDDRIYRKYSEGKKINIVFVCHRPSIWGSLRSVYDVFNSDERFNVSIVAIPNKIDHPIYKYHHNMYESEGAEIFWKEYECVCGYDYTSYKWFDLTDLEPDYVFFQQPYNIKMPKKYRSNIVSKYAKIAYVAYFSPIVFDDTYESSTPLDFLRSLSFFFTQHREDDDFIKKRFELIKYDFCSIHMTGCPRFDNIMKYEGCTCDVWNHLHSYKVIWTPRWTTNEGNCHFFDYKDKILDFFINNSNYELAFRPHPQAFKEWLSTGEMTLDQQNEYRNKYEIYSNLHLDESSDYYPLIFTSDCLITDRSTMIVDYLCTKKPIIYCTSNGVHDSVIDEFKKGLYMVSNWGELINTMTNLYNGFDPLLNARIDICNDYLMIGKSSAAEKIKNVLLADIQK